MMPDSTQGGEKNSSVRSSSTKRRSDDKQAKSESHKKSSKQRPSSSTSSASIKAQASRQKQSLHPIEHYVDSPNEMIDQLFQTVQGEELCVLLPSILKSVPLEELKALCLKQLQQMSKDEIIKIVTGVEDSTEKTPSVDPLPDSTSTETDVTSVKPKEEPSKDGVITKPSTTTQEEAQRSVSGPTSQGGASHLGDKKVASAAEAESNSDLSSSLTKMQMEILELELRARAIKALLRSQGMTDEKEESLLMATRQKAHALKQKPKGEDSKK